MPQNRNQMIRRAHTLPKGSSERKVLLAKLAAQSREGAFRPAGFANIEEVIALMEGWRGGSGWYDADLLAGRRPAKGLVLDDLFGLGVALGRGKGPKKDIQLVADFLKTLL